MIGLVPVKRIGVVRRVRFRRKFILLVFNLEIFRRIMQRAVPVVVIANRAIQLVIFQQSLHGLKLRFFCPVRQAVDIHAGFNGCGAGAHQFSVHLHHARVTGLDGAEIRVVTHMRDIVVVGFRYFQNALSCLALVLLTVDLDRQRLFGYRFLHHYSTARN